MKRKKFHLSLKAKLILSLSAIAVTLILSSTISVMEYGRMSNYVSSLIAQNIKSINTAQRLSELSSGYNLGILAVIGDENRNELPDFDRDAFIAHCDSLRQTLSGKYQTPLADSVLYSYSAYMLTSLELPDVLIDDFTDSRIWYFERLQPRFGRLKRDIDKMTEVIYDDLEMNSANFDSGFYRSIIPGIVAVSVGLLLLLMFLFFLLAYYVSPIYKMLSNLSNYMTIGKKYAYTFDGDDQLSELNRDITELANDNQQLRKRLNLKR
ncbi:MAG: hypothetical protein IJS07_04585 [Bacteroidales bacterium]|nr:hypothetical protein [Bacteroidales bacterium]